MAIDKAEWQYDSAMKEYCDITDKQQGELTSDDENTIWEYAGNHIAFFITWLIRHDLIGDLHHEDAEEETDLEEVKEQKKTGMFILGKYCDMVLTDEDISEVALEFVEEYYEKQYLNDFGTVMDGKILCVGFSWDDYLKVEPFIDAAYKKYKE
ncbi:MAG: hypothetical protein ILN61_03110 [Lachnospiraceae bacterium]|nr:hypothetical protein [Lachnospiraceae bacterium]MBP5414221.1 hypothetical protein [Lachnospiraceae bacterium]